MNNATRALEAYLVTKEKFIEAQQDLAQAFYVKDFDEVQDARHESWGIERGKHFTSALFAPNAEILLEAVRVSRSPGDELGIRTYPRGLSSGRLAQLSEDKCVVRAGELIGLLLEADNILTLVVVHADRCVQIPERTR